MSDWTFDIGPYYVGAVRGGHTTVGLCLDDDSLEVDLEAGGGYTREHLTAYVPVSVLRRLLEGKGYTLAGPQPSGLTTEHERK